MGIGKNLTEARLEIENVEINLQRQDLSRP